VNICAKMCDWKNELSLLMKKTVILRFFSILLYTFSLADVFFSFYCLRNPNVWMITIGIFPRPSTTLPLHCINYRIEINLTARSSDRSTRVRSLLTLNQSFIFHTATHSLQTKNWREYCDAHKRTAQIYRESIYRYICPLLFLARNSSETKRIWNSFTENTHDQREFYSLWSTRYYKLKFIIPVRYDIYASKNLGCVVNG